jgi:hypothetical protein
LSEFQNPGQTPKLLPGKGDDAFEIRVVLQKRNPFGIRNPKKTSIRKSRFQEMHGRQGVNDIAKRAWFDNEH